MIVIMDDDNKKKKIIEIYKNNNLTNVEKQIEINKIMNPNSLIFNKKNNSENEEGIILVNNCDKEERDKHLSISYISISFKN